jgi:hypothetical protein
MWRMCSENPTTCIGNTTTKGNHYIVLDWQPSTLINTPPHIVQHPPWEFGVPVIRNIAILLGMGCGSTTMCENNCWYILGHCMHLDNVPGTIPWEYGPTMCALHYTREICTSQASSNYQCWGLAVYIWGGHKGGMHHPSTHTSRSTYVGTTFTIQYIKSTIMAPSVPPWSNTNCCRTPIL